ncbi:MAG: DNA alkylation repair protein [Bacteroidales bacterium]
MTETQFKHKCGGFEKENLMYLSKNQSSDDLQIKIRELKKQLRSVMNGVASSSMSERGLGYKVNYGVPLTIIKQIAAKTEKNHDLAQLLWMENVRELNILATIIQPVDTFTVQLANSWVNRITQFEQAEQACMNLFQHLSFASALIFDWLKSDSDLIRFTAWHLLARITKKEITIDNQQFKFILQVAFNDLDCANIALFNAALLGLKRVGVMNTNFAYSILKSIEIHSFSNPELKLQLFNDLKFEFDYYGLTSL